MTIQVYDFMLVIWGFVMGFVGWGSCFRGVPMIIDWLSQEHEKQSIAKALILQLITITFVIFIIMAHIVAFPLFLLVFSGQVTHDTWLRLLGDSWFASMLGFIFYGKYFARW